MTKYTEHTHKNIKHNMNWTKLLSPLDQKLKKDPQVLLVYICLYSIVRPVFTALVVVSRYIEYIIQFGLYIQLRHLLLEWSTGGQKVVPILHWAISTHLTKTFFLIFICEAAFLHLQWQNIHHQLHLHIMSLNLYHAVGDFSYQNL